MRLLITIGLLFCCADHLQIKMLTIKDTNIYLFSNHIIPKTYKLSSNSQIHIYFCK